MLVLPHNSFMDGKMSVKLRGLMHGKIYITIERDGVVNSMVGCVVLVMV